MSAQAAAHGVVTSSIGPPTITNPISPTNSPPAIAVGRSVLPLMSGIVSAATSQPPSSSVSATKTVAVAISPITVPRPSAGRTCGPSQAPTIGAAGIPSANRGAGPIGIVTIVTTDAIATATNAPTIRLAPRL